MHDNAAIDGFSLDLVGRKLLAVFEEIFGSGLFWVMVAIATLVTMTYLYVLIRDRAMSMRKFLCAQLAMPFGAIGAMFFLQTVTHSGFRDIGGPIDVIILLGVAVIGAVGLAILVYTSQSLFRSKSSAG